MQLCTSMMKMPGSLPKSIKKLYIFLVIVLITALLIENPFGSAFVTSLTSQEFVLAHLKDAADYFFKEESEAEYRLATGTYEEQKDGPLFGAAEGRNLIVVQLESMQGIMVQNDYYGQEITPFINELIGDPGTIYFDNFYHQIGAGNTSDAEFAVNNSLIGSIESYTYQLYQDNYFRGLPHLLKDMGYNTNVFHGYKKSFWNRENVYPTLGFDRFYGGEDFVSDNIDGIGAGNIVGISDSAFYKQSVDYMKELPQPFYGFVISLSSHNPFGLPDYLQEIELEPQDENIVGRYIQSENYADRCLSEFFDELKEAGLYDNSLILIYGDHFALSHADEQVSAVTSTWLGREYTYDDMMRIPFLIHMPGMDINETVSISGGQIDILPTVSYLLGIEELDTLYLGQNLLTADSGFVPFQMHMLKGSFIKDDIVFEMSRDGVFENSNVYNRRTREKLDPVDYYDDYLRAKETIELSAFYLENDILRLALEEGRTIEQINVLISGKRSVEKNLFGYSLTADDHAGIDEAYRRIAEKTAADDSYYAAVSADDILTVLSYIEEKYSGKSGKKGTILSVDESVNAEYLRFRAHVYPITDIAGEMTKIEYMGYDNVIVRPDPENLSPGQLYEFVQASRPAGILLDEETVIAYGSVLGVLDCVKYREAGIAAMRAADGVIFTEQQRTL